MASVSASCILIKPPLAPRIAAPTSKTTCQRSRVQAPVPQIYPSLRSTLWTSQTTSSTQDPFQAGAQLVGKNQTVPAKGVRMAVAHGASSPAKPAAKAPFYDFPGFLTDLAQDKQKGWSDFIAGQMESAQQGNPQENDGPRQQFLNASNPQTPLVNPVTYKDIAWTAFPRKVQVETGSDQARWKAADASRSVQDEYCEWSVTRDPSTGKITKVTFTSEGPEYWQYLAQVDPAKVLALYQQHVSPNVKMADLFDKTNEYNGLNKWNSTTTNGAMHLVQVNNTLGAEIELAGGSSIVRSSGGEVLTDPQDLIQCGRYGNPQRNSDPHIGSEVNTLARAKAFLTIKNPVALYIDSLDASTWTTPDGTDAQTFWTISRGSPEFGLRAVYEVPKDKKYVVGDIQTTPGQTIDYAAQIADFIQIRLTGAACRIGQANFQPVDGCWHQAKAAKAAAAPAVRLGGKATKHARHRMHSSCD